jgi:2-methylcitrate dehydratase
VPADSEVVQVRVRTDEAAYDHLLRIREDPWSPVSRETADHSLPYIVAAAVLDGRLHTDSFSPGRVDDPERRRFLRDRVTVEVGPELCQGADGGFPSRVEIETADGSVFVSDGAPPPGHPRNPFRERDFEDKLHENADRVLGRERVDELISMIRSLEGLPRVAQLTKELVAAEGVEIDGTPAE